MLPGHLLDLGHCDYDEVRALQHRLVEARLTGAIPDTLVIVEHNPVITLGRRAPEAHILASPETLGALGIVVRRVERGGDVTYHGPGQVVAYPIVHLASHGLGVGDYMHLLEQAMIETLGACGLAAHRREGLIGVWVGGNKIGALGVRVHRGVTYHGLALNVAPDMDHWATIIPCGITDAGVTSLEREVSPAPTMAAVRRRVAECVANGLDLELTATTREGVEPFLGAVMPLDEPRAS